MFEFLVGVVKQATKKKNVRRVKVGAKEIEVSMLQFANDTLFLCEAKCS